MQSGTGGAAEAVRAAPVAGKTAVSEMQRNTETMKHENEKRPAFVGRFLSFVGLQNILGNVSARGAQVHRLLFNIAVRLLLGHIEILD